MANREPSSEIRIWPGVVIVLLQLLVTFGSGLLAPATPIQFFGMMAGPLGGTLLLLVWWLFASRARWPDRILGVSLLLAFLAGTFALAHPTMPMAIFIYGLPLVCAAFVAWAWLTRGWATGPRRLALATALLLACGVWPLLRSDGVGGDLSVEFAWRWQATAEEVLLAQTQLPPAPPQVDDVSEAATPATPSEPAEEPATSQIATAAEPAPPAESLEEVATPAEPAADAADESATVLTLPASEDTGDGVRWPGFRGAHRDGVVPGLRIATDWTASPPQQLWRRPVGPGWSSFAVAGDRLYTQEQRGEHEIVACYGAEDGEPLWMHRDPIRFTEPMAGPGPRATPALHAGRIYAFGATGLLNALDATTGTRLWHRDAAADTGATVPEWGFASSPLVVDGLVVVHTGASADKAAVAYDADSGEPVWFAPAGALSYSSAHLAEVGGVRQVILLSGDGAVGLAPADGAVLWRHDWPLEGAARVTQPAVTADGRVLVGTGFGFGTRSLRVVPAASGGWQVEEGWTSKQLKPYYNDFVVHRGHVYGFDGRILTSLDLATGERAWKGGRYGNGQLLLLPDQDLLLVLSDRGQIALVRATPDAFEEVASMEAIRGKTWNHPVVAGGVLYVRNGEEMAAFRLPQP